MSCFENTKYECADGNLRLCNRCSIEEIEESTPCWLAMKLVGHCFASVEDKKRLLAIQASSSTSSTGKLRKRTVNTNREANNSAVAGQNLFFFGGGGGQLGRAKPRGVRGKNSLKMFEISFLKSLQMLPILRTSSCIWGTYLLLLFLSISP